MNYVAIRMLMGDRAKYIGIIMGVTFAALLITQQASIFWGIMSRTFGFIRDTSLPNIWVMDPKVQYIDDLKPMQDTQLLRVRGVEGVEWATPLYKGMLRVRLENGLFQNCNVIGLDDATLIGGPPKMLQGELSDLRRAEGVIVDIAGAEGRLARTLPDGTRAPLKVGDTLELNDHRAIVVGICQVSRTFQSQPVIYTTYTRATTFAPQERKLLSFILAKSGPGKDPKAVCEQITRVTGLAAYTAEDFKVMTLRYFVKYTGIPINFGMSVVLGFLVGTAIAGSVFYNFTHDNINHFAARKAMGTTDRRLFGMIVLQALVVGLIGYGLGVGGAALFGRMSGSTELAFRMVWQIPVGAGVAITLICCISAAIAIVKVVRLEPGIVFKG